MDSLNHVEPGPIKINVKNLLYCNKKCKLGKSFKGTKTNPAKVTVKIIHGVPGNSESQPYISIPLVKGNYIIKYKTTEYILYRILIFKSNSKIHSPPKTGESVREIFLHLTEKGNPGNPLLILSFFIENSDSISKSGDFFTQIFDKLLLNNDQLTEFNKQNLGNGEKSYDIETDQNWGPNMLIPKNHTFYKYNCKFPNKLVKNDDSLHNMSARECNWIIFHGIGSMLTITSNIIDKLLNETPGGTRRLIKTPLRAPIFPVYKYTDNKYREKLDVESLVVKCEKDGTIACDDDDIIESKKSRIEMNNKTSGCQLTLSNREIISLAKDYKPITIANIFTKALTIIIYLIAIIGAYYTATKLMSVYSSPFNPIQWLTCILRLFWEGILMVMSVLDAARGVPNRLRETSIKKAGISVANKIGDNYSKGIARRKGTSGGNVVDGHTRFANHYRDYMIH